MELKADAHEVPIAHLKWLAKALGPKSIRPILSVAAIFHMDGYAWLVATDTFRMHMLKLFKSNAEGARTLIDVNRVVWEAQYRKSTHMLIDRDFTNIQVARIANGGKTDVAPVMFPDDLPLGNYPDALKVVPNVKTPVKELWAVNLRYFTDAIKMAAENSQRLLFSETSTTGPTSFATLTPIGWLSSCP